MPQLFRGLGMLGFIFFKSSHTIIILLFIVNFLSCCDSTEKFKTDNNVEDKIEIIQGQNDYLDKKNIRLEDFFWTGSGDGLNEPNTEIQNSATIYKTKTVLSTIYIESSPTHHNQTLPEQTTTCPINCDISTTPQDEINPTQTIKPDSNDTDYNTYDAEADRHYWLLTVLKSDGKDPVIIDLKNSLAKLYKTAFQRQQELHLGINGRSKREAKEVDKPVDVYIHKVEKTPSDGEEKIEVLYHVAVSGQPVAATTAAADMHLITDEEVTNELGYPFLIKAEPYLKANDPQYLTSTNSTWVFIGVSLSIVFVLLLLVALLTLALSKRNKSNSDVKDSTPNIGMGISNNAFVSNETERKQEGGKNRKSSTYINFKSKTADRGIFLTRPQSSTSSSSFSVSSFDISPLMGLKKPPSPKRISVTRPKAALNKTVPKHHHRERKMSSDFDSDSSCSKKIRKNSVDVMDSGKDYQCGVVSPKSYLSMPSVKSFPRINCIPEPLNKVLEPVSVLHLDITDDEYPEPSKDYESALTRHASLSTVEDPGVINPAVWNAHTKRLQNEEASVSNNASKMRKRFHSLLDETFSLFGSQRDSSDEKQAGGEIKSHSAVVNRQTQDGQKQAQTRPKTSGPRHSQPYNSEQPRGAWATNVATPLSRSLSAGSFRRPLTATTIDVDRVLVDGSLSPNDIAVPLITAIKTELNKCSLPGSTNNLAE